MTYDELRKVEGRVPSTPEQMAKPLAEGFGFWDGVYRLKGPADSVFR